VLPPPRYPLFNHSALTKSDQSLLAGLSLLSIAEDTLTRSVPESLSGIFEKLGYRISDEIAVFGLTVPVRSLCVSAGLAVLGWRLDEVHPGSF
jgi:hypothetical protein